MSKSIRSYRYSLILLKQLVISDFKLRYQGSVLGYAWSLLRPLFLFIILYIVFARFLKVGDSIPNYPVYLLLGIVLWNYFTEVTTGSVSVIVRNGELLRKINFPKYILIMAGSFSAFINLLLNFIVVGFFMVLTNVHISVSAIIMIPLIIELFVFSTAVAFFLSALYVKFRDMLYIWEVIIQGAFYATPILYPLSLIPDKAAKILILNPMAQIIQDSRYVLVTKETETIHTLWAGNNWVWAIPISIILATVLIATFYFRRQSKFFAEEV